MDHSGTYNEPTISICRKGETDDYHLCNCYDAAGQSLVSNDVDQESISHYCCQCPKDITENYYKQYSVMRKISHFIIISSVIFPQKIKIGGGIGDGKNFELGSVAEELHIKRCPDVTLRNIKNIRNLTVINSETLRLGIS